MPLNLPLFKFLSFFLQYLLIHTINFMPLFDNLKVSASCDGTFYSVGNPFMSVTLFVFVLVIIFSITLSPVCNCICSRAVIDDCDYLWMCKLYFYWVVVLMTW